MLLPIRRIVAHNIGNIASASIAPALAAFFVTLPAIIYLLVAYLNLDLWYDELVTLDLFVFVSTEKVVTNYPFPNNHIFANVINHFYIHAFALEESDLLGNPWKLRILFLFYTVITIIYVYLLGKRFFGGLAGVISALILVTTLPFLNFTLQIRGYSISMSLIGMLIYHSFLYSQRGTWTNGIMVFLSAALTFYSIPSNIYIIFSIALFFFLLFLAERIRTRKEQHDFTTDKKLIVFLLIIFGIIMSVLFYIPVLVKVIDNDFVRSRGYLNTDTILLLMPQFFEQVLSERWILLVPSSIGFSLLVFEAKNKNRSLDLYIFAFLFIVLIFPFFISTIRGDAPFDRTFIPVVVPFSVFFGTLLSKFINLTQIRYFSFFAFIFVLFTSYFSLYRAISERNENILQNIKKGFFEQNITTNYFQKHYAPSKLMKEFVRQYEEGSIVFLESWVDDEAMPKYMYYWSEIYGKTIMEFHRIDGIYPRKEYLQNSKIIYIITKQPNAVQSIEESDPEMDCVRITSPGQWGMVVRCNHRNHPLRSTVRDEFRPWTSLSAWHPAERSGAETYRHWRNIGNQRWMFRRIWLINPYNKPIHVTLALTAESHNGSQPVELWHRTHRLARWEIQQAQRTYRIGTTIAPGQTFLHLRAPVDYDSQSQYKVNITVLNCRIADYVAVERR